MAIVNYHFAKGRLLGEDTNGIRTDYMTDTLGSVTGTVNSSQAVMNTYRYKPFGELLAKTGTGSDPKFMWNGGTQSRRTGIAYTEQYNRARHYGTRQGQWTTVDPLWPRERAYGYCMERPVSKADPFGLSVDFNGCGSSSPLKDCCKDLSGKAPAGVFDKVLACMKDKGRDDERSGNPNTITYFVKMILGFCDSSTGSPKVCVRCEGDGGSLPGWPKNCPNPCTKGYWGYSYPKPPKIEHLLPPDFCGLWVYNTSPSCATAEMFKDSQGKPGCDCTVAMCSSGQNNEIQKGCAVLFHEIAHCQGLGHLGGEPLPPGVFISRPMDFIYKLGCCLCLVMDPSKSCGEECDRLK